MTETVEQKIARLETELSEHADAKNRDEGEIKRLNLENERINRENQKANNQADRCGQGTRMRRSSQNDRTQNTGSSTFMQQSTNHPSSGTNLFMGGLRMGNHPSLESAQQQLNHDIDNALGPRAQTSDGSLSTIKISKLLQEMGLKNPFTISSKKLPILNKLKDKLEEELAVLNDQMSRIQSEQPIEDLSEVDRTNATTTRRRRRKNVQNSLDTNAIQRDHLKDLIKTVEIRSIKLESGNSKQSNTTIHVSADEEETDDDTAEQRPSHRVYNVDDKRDILQRDDSSHNGSNHRSHHRQRKRRSASFSASGTNADDDSNAEDEDVWAKDVRRVTRAYNFYKAPPEAFVNNGGQDVESWMLHLEDHMVNLKCDTESDKVRCLRKNLGLACKLEINGAIPKDKKTSWTAHKRFMLQQYETDEKSIRSNSRVEWKTRDQKKNESLSDYRNALNILRIKAFPKDSITKDEDGSMSQRDEAIQDRFIRGVRSDKLRKNLYETYLSMAEPLNWGLMELVNHSNRFLHRDGALSGCDYCGEDAEHETSDCPKDKARTKVTEDAKKSDQKIFAVDPSYPSYSAPSFNQPRDESRNRGDRPPMLCFTCNKPDHIARDCPDKRQDTKYGESRRQSRPSRSQDQHRYTDSRRNESAEGRHTSRDSRAPERERYGQNFKQDQEKKPRTVKDMWEQMGRIQDEIKRATDPERIARLTAQQECFRYTIKAIQEAEKIPRYSSGEERDNLN